LEILVTLDTIKHHEGESKVCFPPDTLVTKDALIYAADNGIEVYVGDEKVLAPKRKKDLPVKAVISIIGADKVGIIAGITNVLAKNNVNILDITQTAIEGLFTMIAVVDISKSKASFDVLRSELKELGGKLGVRVDAQREEVFHYMHRI